MNLFIEKYYGKLNKFYYFLKLYRLIFEKYHFLYIFGSSRTECRVSLYHQPRDMKQNHLLVITIIRYQSSFSSLLQKTIYAIFRIILDSEQ